MRVLPVATEEQEQRILMQWIELRGLDAFHVPNGGHRNKIVASRLKGIGVRRGVPDVIVITTPNTGEFCGVAIELKRKGTPPSALQPHQNEWLQKFRENGWCAFVARGAGEAIDRLEKLYVRGKQ